MLLEEIYTITQTDICYLIRIFFFIFIRELIRSLFFLMITDTFLLKKKTNLFSYFSFFKKYIGLKNENVENLLCENAI